MNSHATAATPSTEPVLIITQINPYRDELSGYQDDNMEHDPKQVAKNNLAVRKMAAAMKSRNREDQAQAFAELEKLANETPPFLPAVVNVASYLLEGLGTTSSAIKTTVFSLLEHAAAKLNYAPAQAYLGSIEKDKQKAEKYFHQAAAQKHRGAAYKLWSLFCDKPGATKENTRLTCNGIIEDFTWIKPEDESAIEYLKIAADRGDSNAQYYLALVYASEGVQDQKKFEEYLTSSFEQNNPLACWLLALSENEQSQKVDYLKRAAKSHHLASMMKLAELCPEEKIHWLKKAAELGDIEAMQECALAKVEPEKYFPLLAKQYKPQPLESLRDIRLFTGMLPYLPPGSLPALEIDYKQKTEEDPKISTETFTQFSQAMEIHDHPELTDFYCSIFLTGEQAFYLDFLSYIVEQLYSLTLEGHVTLGTLDFLSTHNQDSLKKDNSSARLMSFKINPSTIIKSMDFAECFANFFRKQTGLVELMLPLDVTPETAAILFAPFITIATSPQPVLQTQLQVLELSLWNQEIMAPLAHMLKNNNTLQTCTLNTTGEVTPSKELLTVLARHSSLTTLKLETEKSSQAIPDFLQSLTNTTPLRTLDVICSREDEMRKSDVLSLMGTTGLTSLGLMPIFAKSVVPFCDRNLQLTDLGYEHVCEGECPCARRIDLATLIVRNQFSNLNIQFFRPTLELIPYHLAAIKEALVNNNTTLTELSLGCQVNELNEEEKQTINEISAHLTENREALARVRGNWRGVCLIIAFDRANRDSPFRNSIIPLIVEINRYVESPQPEIVYISQRFFNRRAAVPMLKQDVAKSVHSSPSNQY